MAVLLVEAFAADLTRQQHLDVTLGEAPAHRIAPGHWRLPAQHLAPDSLRRQASVQVGQRAAEMAEQQDAALWVVLQFIQQPHPERIVLRVDISQLLRRFEQLIEDSQSCEQASVCFP